MNILVTGANGQLGNEMRRVSLDSRNRYLFTDVNELDITAVSYTHLNESYFSKRISRSGYPEVVRY